MRAPVAAHPASAAPAYRLTSGAATLARGTPRVRRRVLAGALAVSVAVHFALSLWLHFRR